jgi:protein-arginine kinase activator protein McsA
MNNPSLEFTCPRCGWTHRDLMASGHFRCSACLAVAIGRVGATLGCDRQTVGAGSDDSSRGTPQRVLAELAIGLQLAIKEEDFELAIVLRDTLHFFLAGMEQARPERNRPDHT